MSIIQKINNRITAINSLVCVGLDPRPEQMPSFASQSQEPLFTFNQHIIQQTHPFTVAYKPNMAFYEAYGQAGWRELALTTDYLRTHHADIVTICDAKRADIGSTNEAYAKAIFDDLGFDAVTLHPYLGKEALEPFLQRADKANIILCRTSNQGAGEFQDLRVDGKPLWEYVAQHVTSSWNTHQNCMLVVGATYPNELGRIREIVGEMPILVPGVGAQGGDVAQTVTQGKDAHGRGLLISASRSIIYDENPAQTAQTLRDDINIYR